MHNQPEITEEVLLSWNRCHGAFYQVAASDFLWNQSEQRLLRYWASNVGGVPTFWAEAASEGIELGIPQGGIWLSLWGEIPGGKEALFVAAVEAYAKGLGKSRLAIASDEFHFLPGIPVDEPSGERLALAFQSKGFSQ